MNSVALQRVVVRMLYDEEFAGRAISGIEALPEIHERERGWIRASDLRAFRIDPYRRSRSLTALLDEYPASCAVAIRRAGGVAILDAFFSADQFHEGMQAGQSLALLFGEYLSTSDDFAVRRLAQLEWAIARSRRAVEVATHETRWRLAAGVQALRLAVGSVAAWRSTRERLGEATDSILDLSIELEIADTQNTSRAEYHLLAPTDQGEFRLEAIAAEIYELLTLCADGAGIAQLHELFARHGVASDEADRLLAEYVETGEILPPRS